MRVTFYVNVYDFLRFFPEYMMNTVSLHELVKKNAQVDDSTQKKSQKAVRTTLSTSLFYARPIALQLDVMVNSSKLKITRTEVFFDEFPDIICLGVNSKSLDLSHILQENIGWYLITGVCSEAVLEVIKVEPEVHESPHSLASHAAKGFSSFELTSRCKDSLKNALNPRIEQLAVNVVLERQQLSLKLEVPREAGHGDARAGVAVPPDEGIVGGRLADHVAEDVVHHLRPCLRLHLDLSLLPDGTEGRG